MLVSCLKMPLVLRQGKKKSEGKHGKGQRGGFMFSVFLLWRWTWKRMNLGVPQVVVVSPWIARLVPWEAGTGWDTDKALSLAEKMTRGCPAGNLSSWKPRARYYWMATVKFSTLFQDLGDSSRSNVLPDVTLKQNKTKRRQQRAVTCVCNPSTGGAERGGSLGFTGQPA